MKRTDKTTDQLTIELGEMRQRVVQLETSKNERNQANKRLLLPEEYCTLFELFPVGVTILDMKGMILYCNSAVYNKEGYSKGEFTGKHFSKIASVRLEDIPMYIRMFNSIVRGNIPRSFEIIYQRKDGTEGWSELNIGLVKIGGKRLILVAQHDITGRKRAEEERERLIGDLQATIQELQAFADTISHDIRGPLLTIQGFTEMLRADLEKRETERVEQDIGLIETGTSKMQRLLDGILEYARAGRVVEPIENLPFKEIIEETLQQLAEQISSSGTSISLAESFPTVYADRERMVQAMNNLIQTSTEYCDKNRPLTIEIGHSLLGGELVFFVRDNGVGIKPDKLEKIFELFYRGAKDRQGNDAGLAIAKKVIEAHGGRIWIESEVDKGTTIYFTLPARKDRIKNSQDGRAALESAY